MKRVALLISVVVAGCLSPPYVQVPFDPVAEPARTEVASVVFLVGDAGAARRERSPLVHRLRAEVESWSEALARDSAVTVLFLGDNVYPDGLRARSHPDFAEDSARLHAQVWALEGPNALRFGSLGFFLPGNHDWGNLSDQRGVARLQNQESALRSYAAAGLPVEMAPAAGTPGPTVVDLPGSVRIVMLGTHWWLRSERPELRQRLLRDVRAALENAGGRTVIVAAHHPYMSAGPHTGVRSTRLDPLWLLRRTGAVVQDMNSGPFRSLRSGLADAFEAAGPPLIFTGGHDHSLQVLRGTDARAPTWTLVSGAGSKVTGVAQAPALEWASSQPGYMRLVFLRDGAVRLFVEGLPQALASCDATEAQRCIREGIGAFSTVYSRALR